MSNTLHSPHAITMQAKAMYEQRIRAQVETANIGKYIVIDVDSGDYEMDTDEVTAMKRAARKHPNGSFHVLRVGHRAMGHIGSRTGGVRSDLG